MWRLRFAVLLAGAGGCTVEGCEVNDPILPGESVIHSIYELDGFSVSSATDTIFWSDSGVARARYVYVASLAEAPINTRFQYVIGSRTDGALVADGEGVIVALDEEIRRLTATQRPEPVAVSEGPVRLLAVDRNGPDPLLVWTSGATLSWRPLASQEDPQSVRLPVSSLVDLATTRDFLFVGTYSALGPTGSHGELWKVSRQTGAAVEIARASDFSDRFPRFSEICPGPASVHLSGHLLAEEGVHDRVLWSIVQLSGFAGCDRGLILDVPADQNQGTRVIVDQQWNPGTFSSDGTTLYWTERGTRPSDHMPGFKGGATMWMAPRQGGDPIFAVENLRDVTVVDGHLFGSSVDLSPWESIRRLALPLD